MTSLLDPKFRYHSSADTDLRRTFARVRREQEAAKKPKPLPASNVTKIKGANK